MRNSGSKNLSDAEYRKFIKAIMEGLNMVRVYGNWAVYPWLIEKYGYDAVESELMTRLGDGYRMRAYTYGHSFDNYRFKNTYYILERTDA